MVKFLIKLIAIISLCCGLGYANLGDLSDDDLEHSTVAQGKSALQEEDWEGAIIFFEKALKDLSGSADVQNFLGYAYRKSGNLNKALEHYALALDINPDHKGALEYLGEAYITLGDLSNANVQLEHLKRVCSPIPCEEVIELELAIKRATN
ncbi:MAG: tetratricopeptide repeat protein [Burkholderiales bacterium]|nr:tetratricopeptide repeat protein [Burkholderiales bacterium]|tara:strand:- start:8 stop:460 length:453 start_codon:yes stop_codon:yes gene_type:complete